MCNFTELFKTHQMSPLHLSRVPPIFFLLPALWYMSALLPRSNRVRIWWQESTLISTLAVFISVHSLGGLEVCLFCFLLIFFQGTLLLPVRGTIQLCWAKRSLGAPWKCWKLCTPECLLKKSQITQLSVGCAEEFAPCRYKIFPLSFPVLQYCPQWTNSPYKTETGIRNLIHRKLCQQSNKSPGSAPNP